MPPPPTICAVAAPPLLRQLANSILSSFPVLSAKNGIFCSHCRQRLFYLAIQQVRAAASSTSNRSKESETSKTTVAPGQPRVLPSNIETKKLAQAILTGGKESNVLQRNPGRSVHFRMGQKSPPNEQAASKLPPGTAAGGENKDISATQGMLATAKLSARHFMAGEDVPLGENAMHHPVYTEAELENVRITHHEPENIIDKLAYYTVQLMRFGFDTISGYKFGQLTETKWLNRIIFLETVAAVPGMVGGMIRHLNSLRRMKRDYGWIHTMLEEAENERMHLMTAVHLRQPGFLFRTCVLITQGIFVNFFFIAYMISNKFCHRFVGYLEEEAVKTYTHCLHDIDSGRLEVWRLKRAPKSAIRYWRLREDATMRDMIRNIRADEAHHRVVNHTLAAIQSDTYNPFRNMPQGGASSSNKNDSMNSPPTTSSESGKIPQLVQKSDKRNLPMK